MGVTASTKLQFLWRETSVLKEFRLGVSLHSHTMYSEESLDMVPRYTSKVPYLGAAIRRQQAEYQRRTGCELEFHRAFWTPPFAPRQAYRIEEKQIQRRLQLPAVVSLTDHDDIRAGMHLRVLDRYHATPVSTEWTVPFGPTFFHLGIHNLPGGQASEIMDQLWAFTADPQDRRLGELLSILNGYPDVLLVLNHPLWDEKGIGSTNHAEVLGTLIERHGRHFHALELNGLRSWQENKAVIQLGQQSGLPLVGGGDRHGREPNAIVNLSRADNLVDFVRETRRSRRTHVVFMPSYAEPLKMRVLQTMVDVMREYPENLEGRRRWADRVYYRSPAAAEPVPVSAVWKDGGPKIVRQFVSAMRLLESRTARSMLRIALDDRSKSGQSAFLAYLQAEQEQAVLTLQG